MHDGFTNLEFIDKFKLEYPNDWAKALGEYDKHERKTKSGKSHPCPKPEQYFINALNMFGAKGKKLNKSDNKSDECC